MLSATPSAKRVHPFYPGGEFLRKLRKAEARFFSRLCRNALRRGSASPSSCQINRRLRRRMRRRREILMVVPRRGEPRRSAMWPRYLVLAKIAKTVEQTSKNGRSRKRSPGQDDLISRTLSAFAEMVWLPAEFLQAELRLRP
jgi:hypothetical protein